MGKLTNGLKFISFLGCHKAYRENIGHMTNLKGVREFPFNRKEWKGFTPEDRLYLRSEPRLGKAGNDTKIFLADEAVFDFDNP